SFFGNARIVNIRYAITVGIRATMELHWSWNIRAAVVFVNNAVTIFIGATTGSPRARIFGTFVFTVRNAVVVAVFWFAVRNRHLKCKMDIGITHKLFSKQAKDILCANYHRTHTQGYAQIIISKVIE